MKNKRVMSALSALCDKKSICKNCRNACIIEKKNYKYGFPQVKLEWFCKLKQREVYQNGICNKFTF